MKDNAFDFWQDHSETYLIMAFDRMRVERVHHPDGYGQKKGSCGDSIEIFLTMERGAIQHVAFQVNGCLNTYACCNALAHLVEGQLIQDAWLLLPGDIITFLETLPEKEHHCAELAMGAFYLALKDCRQT